MSNPDQFPAALLARIAELETALRFYAERDHFMLGDEDAWDTVSGEPLNFWCDEAGTATVEDGSIAAAVLAGKSVAAAMKTEAAAMAATVPAVAKFMGRRLTPEGTSEFWGVLLCDPKDDPAEGTLLHMAAQAPVAGQPAEPSPADPHDWLDLDERRPEPEVYVLTWNGREVGIDWFGSLKRPQGTDYTHWAPFKTPPSAGAMYGMHSIPPKEEGMTIAGNGASELGKLMRRQWESRIGVYPDGNPNAAPKGDSNG